MTSTLAQELNRCTNGRLMDARLPADVKARLLSSATRVLVSASGSPNDEVGTPAGPAGDSDERLWNLALAVSALRAQSDELRSIDEAVAALQLASSTLSGSADGIPARIQRLREIGMKTPQRIRPQRNGPYIVTNAVTITDWLGQPLILPPMVALCR